MTVFRRFIDLSDGQLHYKEAGKSQEKGILLLHEMPLSSGVFDKLLPILGESTYVVAPDLPGYGDSYTINNPLTVQDTSQIIMQFLSHLPIRHWAIYGVHGGASVAIEMAEKHPEYISSLILSGIPLLSEEERVKLHASLLPMQIEQDGKHFQQWWFYFEDKFGENTPKDMIHQAVLQIMKAGRTYEWGYRAAFDYDPTDALRKLLQPIFLLVGENDVLVSKNTLALELSRTIRKEKIVRVSGQISQRVPENVANEILSFLQEI